MAAVNLKYKVKESADQNVSSNVCHNLSLDKKFVSISFATLYGFSVTPFTTKNNIQN